MPSFFLYTACVTPTSWFYVVQRPICAKVQVFTAYLLHLLARRVSRRESVVGSNPTQGSSSSFLQRKEGAVLGVVGFAFLPLTTLATHAR